jgi:hypothetical protein
MTPSFSFIVDNLVSGRPAFKDIILKKENEQAVHSSVDTHRKLYKVRNP